jgi:hypothetical protein
MATTATEKLPFHAIPEQSRLLGDYRARTLAAIAGTGGGKTSMGYWWLWLRMEHDPGYGWGLAEPTYQMLAKIVLNSADPDRPDIMTWLKWAHIYKGYKAVDRIIDTTLGQIYLGSADKPDTLQGPALKGYWLDEGGMMSLEAHQTALQRVSFHDGQELITTTPYNRGWLKTEIADKADNDYIHVEKWRSIDNPAFPKHVYDEMRDGPNALQRHRFRMMYDAEFERPEGLIYSSFDDVKHVIKPFNIPKEWPRFVGMDFGPNNLAVVWFAQTPNDKYILYRELMTGKKSTPQHAKDLLRISEGELIQHCAGGVGSESQWRRDFTQAGWRVSMPRIKEVEVGIDRVWGMHNSNRILAFNTCKYYLSQKADYHRKLDANQEPTDVIENKEKYHILDAERYIISDVSSNKWMLV